MLHMSNLSDHLSPTPKSLLQANIKSVLPAVPVDRRASILGNDLGSRIKSAIDEMVMDPTRDPAAGMSLYHKSNIYSYW